MIEATQTAFLVTAVEQRCLAMRAILADQPDAPFRIAKGNQVLAEQAHPDRGAVALVDGDGSVRRVAVGGVADGLAFDAERSTGSTADKLMEMITRYV